MNRKNTMHRSSHHTLSLWSIKTVEESICISHPASKASNICPSRTISSLQTGTNSSHTTISLSHSTNLVNIMTAAMLPGTNNSKHLPSVRVECRTLVMRAITVVVGKSEANSSSSTAEVAAEEVAIQAEDCSTLILCKLVSHNR